ncbi:SDR family NAD(P)-dependent oxidoreductase [Anaerococcus porci]|uniref:SDR family NAD(P)-dependent oxidoreductase n=1 Tax=Anaerococcus porci TaxID=2652269 RepID=UPI002A751A9C|nr:SDR family NAD(P)-dependent oxidoreductase [Anaerococcus porci]MDY3005750.1 SDR family NAD(P)-dependent oxidoreductase [Anaerococcus porci]
MLLKDKVAVITGAGSGFGKLTSKLFAKEGAKIVAVDYNEESAKETVEEIKKDGGEAISVKADVSKDSDVKNFIAEAVNEFGKIDILFNNAGVFKPGNVEEVSFDDFKTSFGVNVDSIFLACKYAMKYLKESKGVIVNTASAGGIIGFPQAVAYGASKGAVISLTQALAVDYAKDGIRVNAICPGTSKTGMTKEALEDKDMCNAYLSPIPMARFGTVEDIAKAALFLASDQSSYITGHALPVDGGWTMS